MKTDRPAITGWKAVLLAPLALPFAAIAGIFAKPAKRTAVELAQLIEEFLDGDNDWAWDEIESVPVADPNLETIRQRAVSFGPPEAGEDGLRDIVRELKQI